MDILIMLIIAALPFVGGFVVLCGLVLQLFGLRQARGVVRAGLVMTLLGAIGWALQGTISQFLFPGGHL